jgi:hypothetical protein
VSAVGGRRIAGCFATAALLLAACGQQVPPGAASLVADAAAAVDVALIAPQATVDTGPAPAPADAAMTAEPPDAANVSGDAPAAVRDAEPDSTPDAQAGPDSAPDAAPPPPDAPLPPECTPGARACGEGPAARLCGDQGHWLPVESCGSGSICSGGACVCPGGGCEDGVLHSEPGFVVEISVAGNVLYYMYASYPVPTDIRSIDIHTGAPGPVQKASAGYRVNNGLAADASAGLYWCRRLSDEFAPIEGALMLGDRVVAPGACTKLLLTPTHVFFMLDEETGLFRVPRAPGGPVKRETVTMKYPASFWATPTHIYFASADDFPRIWSRIERVPLDDFTHPQTVAERAAFDTHIFDHMAIDGSHLYTSYNGQILRAPADGGDFQTFWTSSGSDIQAIVLSDTHVYWSTVIESERGCAEAAFWRRSKVRDDEATLLLSREGVCPQGLALTPDRLYVATAGLPGPSQILRLRR